MPGKPGIQGLGQGLLLGLQLLQPLLPAGQLDLLFLEQGQNPGHLPVKQAAARALQLLEGDNFLLSRVLPACPGIGGQAVQAPGHGEYPNLPILEFLLDFRAEPFPLRAEYLYHAPILALVASRVIQGLGVLL